MFLSAQQVKGDMVSMLQNNARHINPNATGTEKGGPEKAFGQMFLDAFGEVNDLQQNAAALAQQMITSPDSVDVHDVTIATSEANLSLAMTKAVVDGVIRAYKEIMNTR